MEQTLEFKSISQWGIDLPAGPLVIAGPCSAETEKQVRETAHQVAQQGIKIFRAGIWKPRTRPNTFEGVGVRGLPWLKKVKEDTGMLVATEVANQKHAYEALKHGVDILWIGARTTANPFAVQEIATAISGADVPVLIKNPVNPEVDLWIGAIERFYEVGFRKLGAIHRGFSTYEKTSYRNIPLWQAPIELGRRLKGLPILVDPSHICGHRELRRVSQKALDLNYDGLIIETHHDPDHALSDAMQQITPAALSTLLSSLKFREVKTSNLEFRHTLETLRHQIDELDDELLDVLQKRMSIVETIGKYKKDNNVTILQPDRWDEIIMQMNKKGTDRNLSEKFIELLFTAIHQESINKQNTIMNNGESFAK
nr:bifunctional 3-deoxy-7-phosphoheptulonate synthase/chorismate mutase type II [Bacteroidota bacterium]